MLRRTAEKVGLDSGRVEEVLAGQEYADAVGADGYAADASQTVKRAKALLEAKRTKVLA